MARKRHRRAAVLLFLCAEDLVYLPHGSAHLGQRVHKVERRHDGSRHAQCQNDDGQEGLGAQTAVQPQQPARRQDGQHLRREEAVSHGHAQLALLHPVDIILGIVPYFFGQACIRFLSLVERLDDLDAVDVLDEGAAHLIGGLHRAGIVLAVAAHDGHHEEECHREHHQAQQRQPPVQHKQIHDGQHRGGDVRGHLREQMCQGRFHAVHLVHDGLLQLAAGGVHHGAQGQLGQQHLPDGLEDVVGRFVRNGQCAVVQHRAQQISAQCREQPGSIGVQRLFPGQQQSDDLCRRKIRHHAAYRAEHRQHNGCDEPAVLCFSPLPDAPYRALLFHSESLLEISID